MTGSIGKTNLAFFYHDYSADEGSADYGEEYNAVASYPINKYVGVELKYAKYDADEFSQDTDKIWFSVNVKF